MDDYEAWYNDMMASAELKSVDDYGALETVVITIPNDFTSHFHSSIDAIVFAYWMDGCFKLCKYYRSKGQPEKAYSYLEFAYAKLQAVLSSEQLDLSLNQWCLARLEQFLLIMLEFCQQQEEAIWLERSRELVDLHLLYINAQSKPQEELVHLDD